METLLDVRDLATSFRTPEGKVRAVDGISLSLAAGETLALVGESGCGKSVTARSIMGLYSGSRVSQSGSILFRGEDLSQARPERRASLRGGAMAMIFQEPMSAFDPLATIGGQMVDARLAHAAKAVRAEAERMAVESLRSVGIPDPEIRLRDYPHRLSGGMLQRVLIAIALMNEPTLLVADEPTTALDVTIQAQVLRLIRDLCLRRGTGVLFITHDLGIVAEMADRVHLMYAGRIVEKATVGEFFGNPGPLHPYGAGLLASRIRRESSKDSLPSIPGTVPKLLDLPQGCRFSPRCLRAGERCRRDEPPLAALDSSGGCIGSAADGPIPTSEGQAAEGAGPRLREVACWLYQGGVA